MMLLGPSSWTLVTLVHAPRLVHESPLIRFGRVADLQRLVFTSLSMASVAFL